MALSIAVSFWYFEAMKGKVIVSKFWTRLFSLGKAQAITIFPFIFLRNQRFRQDAILLNHERIHLRQALELLIVPFYTWYVLEFLFHWIRLRSFHRAYLAISFEREAYQNDHNLAYLKTRRFWAFRKYL